MTNLSDMYKAVGINRLVNINASGISSILFNTDKYDVFNLTNIQNNCTFSIANLDIGKTIMFVLNAPGEITIIFDETILWPDGSPPTYTTGKDTVVVTRVDSNMVIGSYTLNHS